ncbi:deoxyguanosinetriphosphate triphosphohydrolase [Bartonella sp. TP]|uniref:deoxyguanosinetriphosphate triphosphohydrolase n=1 Tax=Bartonella sp. TP TaxID=3057550 RepID=UPI0025B258E3|nr:deoxyguanosinetriphosphate triphosphohydrolase [Bartonella sp. TP]MDN5248767.1 deoxyguanosinetriphosphate triphosphohydrolase [Alphaproteobacteria bacterium]WJW79997.1 deoxyguanosinetriphosphate triphosphohydrolase [Bartonella sp. TP]
MSTYLACYATQGHACEKRLYAEPADPWRSAFQRDRDRIIHSKAFRRLIHKTQVLPSNEGDHYRTRLIHSIEVAQIARSLACRLQLDQDLSEAIALAHDLGHPPFAHAGEDILKILMQDYGGFDHNAQTLLIVTKLEKQYYEYDGLNLSWAMLEGLAKHNGPLTATLAQSEIFASFNAQFDLSLDKFAGLEAQCAAIADDIAYDSHDIDDALRSNFIQLQDLQHLQLPGQILAEIEAEYPGLASSNPALCGRIFTRKQVALMLKDVFEQSSKNLQQLAPKSPEDIYNAGQQQISFSPSMQVREKELKRFLYENFYQTPSLLKKRDKVYDIISALFASYMHDASLMPVEWRPQKSGEREKAAMISNYIAGMTDIYAENMYNHLRGAI